MPSSKRPSPHAAMDAAARLQPSPPRSKKRSSRPKSRSGDRRRRRSPNPNPRFRGNHSGSAAPSRKSERKRKPRYFADSNSLALTSAAPASSSGGGGHGAVQKLWTDADEVALLTGAVSFRARNGDAPRLPDMGALFESLRDSLSPHLDQAKVYYKLKRLKSKFFNSVPAATSGPHERLVHDLSADLWGAELAPPDEDDADAEEAEEGDADEGYTGADVTVAVRLPLVSKLLGEYWRRNGRALSEVSLEQGLALLGAEEARVAETKWRRHIDAEMRTQVRRHDLAKEVYGLLIDAVKGLGP